MTEWPPLLDVSQYGTLLFFSSMLQTSFHYQPIWLKSNYSKISLLLRFPNINTVPVTQPGNFVALHEFLNFQSKSFFAVVVVVVLKNLLPSRLFAK